MQHIRKHFLFFKHIYIYFATFHGKSGILILDLYFHNVKKKNTNHELNTRENQ